MSKLIDSNTTKRITESEQPRHIVEFPKALCLQHCDMDIVKGYEKFVFTTLKSFSDKDKFNSKDPHPLNKSNKLEKHFKIAEQEGNGKVFSLDLKSRNDTYRLLYCVNRNQVHKILALCTSESH